jgi:cytochrome c oxidase subunit II
MLEWMGMPVAASAHAAELDYMTLLVHWLMIVLFVGWGGFFLYTLVRFRSGRNPKADYAGIKSHFSSYSEGGVALAEVILLAGFSIPAWAARADAFPPEHEAVVVRVVAEQFAWNVHYPGPDGEFGRTDVSLVSSANPLGLDRSDPKAADDITTINMLVLPVDRPAIIHLSSKDVIHSFGVPVMRVKQDAIPGLMLPLWFVPTATTPVGEDGEPRLWEIVCSQLCGLGHYRMRGFIDIKTEADFQAWLDEEGGAPPGAESEETSEPVTEVATAGHRH